MSISEQASGSRGTTSRTCIWGLVTVPVLSTHSTSTRARVSVSRNSPSGIMPIRAATVLTTDCRRPRSWLANWL